MCDFDTYVFGSRTVSFNGLRLQRVRSEFGWRRAVGEQFFVDVADADFDHDDNECLAQRSPERRHGYRLKCDRDIRSDWDGAVQEWLDGHNGMCRGRAQLGVRRLQYSGARLGIQFPQCGLFGQCQIRDLNLVDIGVHNGQFDSLRAVIPTGHYDH